MALERVLFVDDEPALVALTVRALSRLGYRMTGYSDPLQAFAVFKEQPTAFDGVVTDLSMPSMSGIALARKIHQIRSDLPIAMMSGYFTVEDQRQFSECGIQEIILKPITLDQLGDAIGRLFASSSRL